jgi:hypothetical protein
MTRFTLRDVFWLTLVVAVALGMWGAWRQDSVNYRRRIKAMAEEYDDYRVKVKMPATVIINKAPHELPAGHRMIIEAGGDSHAFIFTEKKPDAATSPGVQESK